MIRALIFDVGGVLVRTGTRASRSHWEQRLGMAERESEQVVFDSPMGVRAQQGDITDAELWAWVRKRLSLTEADLAAFRRGFWADDRLDRSMVAFIRRLRPRYQTAIISNATDSLRHTLSTTYPIADAFDLIVCSAEEKVMKPDPRIFQRTCRRLQRSPAECVFVDDFAHNVAAARQLGMQAVHYRDGLDVPAALAALGVELAD